METVFFRLDGVNLRVYLCGVPTLSTAQPLDFLAGTKNPSFPNWKQSSVSSKLPDGHCLKFKVYGLLALNIEY
jgi:hypothetical protein